MVVVVFGVSVVGEVSVGIVGGGAQGAAGELVGSVGGELFGDAIDLAVVQVPAAVVGVGLCVRAESPSSADMGQRVVRNEKAPLVWRGLSRIADGFKGPSGYLG